MHNDSTAMGACKTIDTIQAPAAQLELKHTGHS